MNRMEQEQINYGEIIALGFNEEVQHDKVYLNAHGFEYCIITKDLTKKIYLDWAKETRLCKMVRIDHQKECNIKSEMPIRNLEHLKEIITFFCDEVG